MTRTFDNGTITAAVIPLLLGRARIIIGPTKDWESGYSDGWCFESAEAAVVAFAIWDGPPSEPQGWCRHIRSGRRRPSGDPQKEYIPDP